jgi:hypothetical protein
MGFENRLLDHKRQYFSTLPFPYMRQSSMTWQLYGPYANQGNLAQSFAPELAGQGNADIPAWGEVTGGTVVLRHWWAPVIQGALQAARDSTTWYATTRVWSDEDKLQPCWIGFNDLSRSPATDSPLPGTWDNKQSKIWVNGIEILPPLWTHGGQKGHPEIPLADEGYSYRAPIMVWLNKGWNKVLVKAPVGSLKGPDWQNPVKWMFTFVQVDE